MKNSKLVVDFVDQIWNNRNFNALDNFLHEEFTDHSLPAGLPRNKEGLKKWIIATGVAFEHKTIIESQVTEGDMSMIKIRMNLKHIGIWRNIEPNGTELETVGYRHFQMKEGKIVGHWALVDGEWIESQLSNCAHGCKIAK